MEPLTLTILAGLMQVSPTQCQFDLLHPNGVIDTHQIACERVILEELLPIEKL